MTRQSLSFLLFLKCLISFGQNNSRVSSDTLYHKTDGEKIFLMSQVDSIPKYLPNNNEMYSFIAKNLNYPPDARENGIQGKVYSSFIIEKDGTISDIIIIKGFYEPCDNEVKRVISDLPNKWRPALKDGQPVRFQYLLPLTFKMEGVKTKKRK